MSFEPKLFIDLSAVRHNYELLQKSAPNTEVAAVVKNNAYGLGAEQIAQTLSEKSHCRTFFVAYAAEGEKVRKVAPDALIYLLNGLCKEDIPTIKKHRLTPVLSSMDQIKIWNEAQIKDIHPALQVETGLHRLGISLNEAENIPLQERQNFSLILSHLASADELKNPSNQHQCQTLERFKSLFEKAHFSLAASDGMALGDSFYFNLTRPGAFLYGLHVNPTLRHTQRTVVTASASILQTKMLNKGDAVGYNATFKAPCSMKVAALSVGYGDGLLRTLSGQGAAWFKKGDVWLKAPFVGRISMDITMCDVTEIPEALLDTGSAFLLNDIYTPNDMGTDAGTIGYEILSSLAHTPRWKKIYLNT